MAATFGRETSSARVQSLPQRQPASVACSNYARGQTPIQLKSGEPRRFLEDGDEVILRAYTWPDREFARTGWGERRGKIMPGQANW